MSSNLQLDVRHHSQWWRRRLMNAYEVKARMVLSQVRRQTVSHTCTVAAAAFDSCLLCWSHSGLGCAPNRSNKSEPLRYINSLIPLSLPLPLPFK